MGDDFGALELDTELDEDMRALFGESQAVAGPSMPGTQALPARSFNVLSEPRGTNVPRCPSTASQLPRGGQSLACITNKRPAIEINQSWPHKARVLTQTPHAWHDDTAYDDLDLEASAPASSAVSGTFSSNNRQNSTFEASRKDLPANTTGVCNVMPNAASQATELWHSAYSQRPVQASAASALLQSAYDLRQPSLSQQSVALTSAGRQALPGSANINSRTALVSRLHQHKPLDQCQSVYYWIVSGCTDNLQICSKRQTDVAGRLMSAWASRGTAKSTSSRSANAPHG